MSVIVFENPEEIDINSIRMFGINVKTTDSAIGFFGTGLKYAVAVLLRTGHTIHIYSGTKKFFIYRGRMNFRGKDFESVILQEEGEEPHQLSFTTELGKNWEVWMAYRELYCNAKDEAGETYEISQEPTPEPEVTRVIVEGSKIREVHHLRHTFVLETEPLEKLPLLEVHEGTNQYVFYRGMRAYELPRGRTAAYTYNLTGCLMLTEDRTAKHPFLIPGLLRDEIVKSSDRSIIRRAIIAPKHALEADFVFSKSHRFSDTFLEVLEEEASKNVAMINQSLLAAYKLLKLEDLVPAKMTLSDLHAKMLSKAVRFCARIGYDTSRYPIVVADSLGSGILGLADHGRIYISRESFDMGTKQVAITLLEEFLHLDREVADESRQMQDLLMTKIVSIGEEMIGEPL